MSFQKLFVVISFMALLDGQELDICDSGACVWNNPSSSKILVCLSTAGSCTVNCNIFNINGQCQGLIVYNLSPILIVHCDNTDSCKYINIYCGPFEPPNIEHYGLTSSDFSNPYISVCNVVSNTNALNVGQYAQMHCTGKISQCYALSNNYGMNDIVLYCNGITQASAYCYVHCQTSNGCNNGTIYCVSSTANCYTTAFANYGVQIKYFISDSPTIYAITRSPTKLPIITPSTSNPTRIPSITPTSIPTQSHFPTTTPTIAPSSATIMSPTISPTVSPTISLTIPPTITPTIRPNNASGNNSTGATTLTSTPTTTSSPTKTSHLPSYLPSYLPSHIPTFIPTISPTTFDKEQIISTKSSNWIIWAASLLLLLLLFIGALLYIIYLKRKQQTNVVNSVKDGSVAMHSNKYDNIYIPQQEGVLQTPSNVMEGEPHHNIHLNEETFPLSNNAAVINDSLIAKEYMLNQHDIEELTKGNAQMNEFITIK